MSPNTAWDIVILKIKAFTVDLKFKFNCLITYAHLCLYFSHVILKSPVGISFSVKTIILEDRNDALITYIAYSETHGQV